MDQTTQPFQVLRFDVTQKGRGLIKEAAYKGVLPASWTSLSPSPAQLCGFPGRKDGQGGIAGGEPRFVVLCLPGLRNGPPGGKKWGWHGFTRPPVLLGPAVLSLCHDC